jgi:hypothetical protein
MILLSFPDNGTQFTSKFFQTVCRLLGVKQLFTTAYHPSMIGQVERFNQTVLKSVTHFVSEHQDDWDEIAGVAMYAYNTTIQNTTVFAPFELIVFHLPVFFSPTLFSVVILLCPPRLFSGRTSYVVSRNWGRLLVKLCPFGSRDTRTTMIVSCKGEILRSSLVILSMSRGLILFCRPDQLSRSSYVDDNSCLLVSSLPLFFLHDDFASRHLHI